MDKADTYNTDELISFPQIAVAGSSPSRFVFISVLIFKISLGQKIILDQTYIIIIIICVS